MQTAHLRAMRAHAEFTAQQAAPEMAGAAPELVCASVAVGTFAAMHSPLCHTLTDGTVTVAVTTHDGASARMRVPGVLRTHDVVV